MKIISANTTFSEIELDTEKAFYRGIALVAVLRGALEPHPRGVFRGDFEFFDKLDA